MDYVHNVGTHWEGVEEKSVVYLHYLHTHTVALWRSAGMMCVQLLERASNTQGGGGGGANIEVWSAAKTRREGGLIVGCGQLQRGERGERSG